MNQILSLVFLTVCLLQQIQVKSQSTFKVSSLVQNNLESKIYSTYNIPVIIENIDNSFIANHTSRLTVNNEREFRNRFTGDSLRLSELELKLIQDSLVKQKEKKWDRTQFPKYRLLKFKDMYEYLAKDDKNTVVVMNEPIYFREDQYAVLFFANLCCGKRIGGYVEFSFYQNKDGKWTKFIEISGGDF